MEPRFSKRLSRSSVTSDAVETSSSSSESGERNSITIVGEPARVALQSYLRQCKKKGLHIHDALKIWRGRKGLKSPTTRACCDLLKVMGQSRNLILLDILDILTSQLNVQINNIPTNIDKNLRLFLFSVVEEASLYLAVPVLQSLVVNLIIRQFSTLRHQIGETLLENISNEIISTPGIEAAGIIMKHSYTRPVQIMLVRHGSDTTEIELWNHLIMSILKRCEHEPQLYEYCRYKAILEFRCVLWPFATDWLLDEFLKLLGPALQCVHRVNYFYENRFSLINQSNRKEEHQFDSFMYDLLVVVSKSSFTYSFFVSLLEILYLGCLHQISFSLDSFLDTCFTNNHMVRNTIKRFLKTNGRDTVLEYKLPSFRVMAISEVAKQQTPSKAAERDPIVYHIISIMERLLLSMLKRSHVKQCSFLISQTIPPLGSSNRRLLAASPTGYWDIETSITHLKSFTIKNMKELLTVSFILSHPQYLHLLIEMFLQSQIMQNSTLLVSLSSSHKTSEMFLGLVILALSFPALHSAMAQNDCIPFQDTSSHIISAGGALMGPTATPARHSPIVFPPEKSYGEDTRSSCGVKRPRRRQRSVGRKDDDDDNNNNNNNNTTTTTTTTNNNNHNNSNNNNNDNNSNNNNSINNNSNNSSNNGTFGRRNSNTIKRKRTPTVGDIFDPFIIDLDSRTEIAEYSDSRATNSSDSDNQFSGITLGLIVQHMRIFATSALSQTTPDSIVFSTMSHTSNKPVFGMATSFIKEIRRHLIHLRPPTIRFLEALNQALGCYNDSDISPRNGFSEFDLKTDCGVRERIFSILSETYKTAKGKASGTAQAMPDAVVNTSLSVSSLCSGSDHIVSQSQDHSEPPKLVDPRRRRRFSLDRRLLTTVILGLIRCACSLPYLTDIVEFILKLETSDVAPSWALIEGVIMVLDDNLLHFQNKGNENSFENNEDEIEYPVVSGRLSTPSAPNAHILVLVYRYLVLPEQERNEMLQLFDTNRNHTCLAFKNSGSQNYIIVEKLRRLEYATIVLSIATSVGVFLMDLEDRKMFIAAKKYIAELLKESVSGDFFEGLTDFFLNELNEALVLLFPNSEEA